MIQFTQKTKWWRLPLLRVAIMMVLLAGMAAVFSSRQFDLTTKDAREALAWGAPTSHQPVTVWPNSSPIPVGSGEYQFSMPSTHQLFSLEFLKLRLVRPQLPQYPYTVYPVFTSPTDWDTSTTAIAYGWVNIPCNQATVALSLNKIYLSADHHYMLDGQREIGLGYINALSNDPQSAEFCVPDPKRPGYNAFRIQGVSATTDTNQMTAASLLAFGANQGAGTFTISKVTVDTPAEEWPPTTGVCGETCAEQKSSVCDTGLECDHSKTKQRTYGQCVIPECVGVECVCTPL